MARESIFTVKAEGGKAVIRIIGSIHEWKNSAVEFMRALDDVIAQGITKATLYLRTEGGSVFEANDIVNAIKKFPGEIECESGALVASAGTYIAVSCSRVRVPKNAQWMFHKPSSEFHGNEDEVERDLKTLKSLTASIAGIYSKKTGKSLKQIEQLWSGGDHWMDANELKAYGFADEIMDSDAEITTEDIAAIRSIGYKNIPRIAATITQPKPIEMKVSAKAAGLQSGATDEEIASVIDNLKKENDDLKKFKGDHERSELAKNKKAITDLVDAAIREKKITTELRDTYITIGEKSGVESLTTVLSGTKGVKPISAEVPDEGSEGESDLAIPQARKDWSFDKWSSEDPKGLRSLHEKHPEAFKKLYKDQFGVDPN